MDDEEMMESLEPGQWYGVTSPGKQAQEVLEEVDLLWKAAWHVGSSIDGLWAKGDSLSRGMADMDNPPEQDLETLYAEGHYDPDPMEVWSHIMQMLYEDGAYYEQANARTQLEDFNSIAAAQGMTDDAEVVCVRVLLQRVLETRGTAVG